MARKIFSQPAEKFIPALAEKLSTIPEFATPEWGYVVKSSTHKQRPPTADNFWQTRAASILRQLYIKGVVGVGKLRSRYGGRKDRGTKPDKFRKASGKIIRTILQQAETAGLVEKVDKLQFGRRLTQKGRDLLDSIEVEAIPSFNINEAMVEIKPQEEEIQEIQQEDIEEDKE